MMQRIVSAAIIFAALLHVSWQLFLQTNAPLNWDEADIAYVARQGIASNFLNKPSAGFLDFAKLGIAKAKNDAETVKALNSSLPDERDDLFIRRHFHPPLSAYYWSLFHTDSNDPWEISSLLRTGNIILLWLFAISLLAATWWASGTTPFNYLSAAIIGLTLPSQYFSEVFLTLNYHLLFGIVAIWYAAAVVKFAMTGKKSVLIFWGVMTAFLITALETHVVIIVLSLVIFFFMKRSGERNFAILGPILVTILISLLVVWAGFFLTGEMLKSWMMYVYRIVFASNDEYSGIGIFSTWLSLFVRYPVLLLTIAITASGAAILGKFPKTYFLPVLTGLGYLIFISPFIIFQHYLFPALALLLFGVLLMTTHSSITQLRHSISSFIVAMGGALYIIGSGISFDSARLADKVRSEITARRSIVRVLKEATDEFNKPLFISGGHIFQFYMPDQKIHLLEAYSRAQPGFYERIEYEYVDQKEEIEQHAYSAVALKKSHNYRQETLDFLSDNGYTRQDLGEYIIYTLSE